MIKGSITLKRVRSAHAYFNFKRLHPDYTVAQLSSMTNVSTSTGFGFQRDFITLGKFLPSIESIIERDKAIIETRKRDKKLIIDYLLSHPRAKYTEMHQDLGITIRILREIVDKLNSVDMLRIHRAKYR